MAQKELILDPHLPCSAFLLHKSIDKLEGIFRKGFTVKMPTGLEGTVSATTTVLRPAFFLFFFSLALFTLPTGHLFTIMEQKQNLCYLCLSLWRVKNEVQVIQTGSQILWWICKGQICRCTLKVKFTPFILPGVFSHVY